jgi:hypothetical protein
MGQLILPDFTLPYKVYSAIITQTGATAPSAIVLQNTLGTITFSYLGLGDYSINSLNLFTTNQTAVLFNLSRDDNSGSEPTIILSRIISDSQIQLLSFEFNAAVPKFQGGDDCINGFLEIRVYN